MSVGDVKGFRRRLKVLKHKGHLPKPSGISIQDAVAREKAIAAAAAKRGKKK